MIDASFMRIELCALCVSVFVSDARFLLVSVLLCLLWWAYRLREISANTLMMNTWISQHRYEFTGLIKVEEVRNEKLLQRYLRYKQQLISHSRGVDLVRTDGNETLVFHGW